MSFELSSGKYLRANPTAAAAISASSFSLFAAFKITTLPASGNAVLMSLYTGGGTWLWTLRVRANGTVFLDRNFEAEQSVDIGTVVADQWFHAGLEGWLDGATKRVRGYLRVGSTVTSQDVTNTQPADTVAEVWMGSAVGYYAQMVGRVANAKMWAVPRGTVGFTAESESAAVVSSANLLMSNTFAGANEAAALSSEFGSGWAATWDKVSIDSGTGSTLTVSTDAPSYSTVPTLGGSDTFPSTNVETGVRVLQSVLGAAVQGATTATVTFPSAVAVGSYVAVTVGGWVGAGGATISVTDNKSGGSHTYTERVKQLAAPRFGENIITGWWTTKVAASSALTITMTFDTPAAYVSLVALEVTDADATAPIVGSGSASGTSTTAAVSIAPSAQPALLLAATTWNNSLQTATPATTWTERREREGGQGVSALSRKVSATTAAQASWTLGVSDTWAAAAIAFVQSGSAPAATAPTITSTAFDAAVAGIAFTQTLAATGTAPITWSATGLPSGLAISTSGTVSGTPAASGTSAVTVTATNSAGSASKALTLTVTDAPIEGSSEWVRVPRDAEVWIRVPRDTQ